MASEDKNGKCSCSCGGCLSLVVFVLLVSALLFGLPTSWGVLNIDIFPPGVYLVK
jgi:hypothetical protein